MIYVQVNGGHHNLNILDEQEKRVRELIFDYSVLSKEQIHDKLCEELRLGKYTPATHAFSFALTRILLEFFSEGRELLASLGGDLVCYSCEKSLKDIPRNTIQCPFCGVNKIKNFKPIIGVVEKWDNPRRGSPL